MVTIYLEGRAEEVIWDPAPGMQGQKVWEVKKHIVYNEKIKSISSKISKRKE